jgi:hypothetical protein
MTDAQTPNNYGDATSGKPATISPSQNGTAPPSKKEITDREGRKIQNNRERFIRGPIKRLILFLDIHNGVVTAAATVIIALATIVNVIYVSGQLSEMKSGNARTDKLIASNADLASAAKTQGEATKEQAKTASASLIASQRAWIGSTDAAIVKSPVGTLIKGTVSYINSGREPAKLQAAALEYVYTRTEWDTGVAGDSIVKRQDDCLGTKTIGWFRFAWPTTGFTNYFMQVPGVRIPEIGAVAWSDNINKGDSIVAIQGCIIYEAFQAIHHTAFCYDYDARITDMAHLNICTVGNAVD